MAAAEPKSVRIALLGSLFPRDARNQNARARALPERDFAELCENLFDGLIEPSILHVPRHCGIGVPDVFFPSRITREPLRSVTRFGLALYVNRKPENG